MKLSFSTLGCPNWTFDEIFAAAKDLGYEAIEIRGLGHEIYAPRIKEFSDFCIDSTIERIANAGLAVSMFTSNAVIGEKGFAEFHGYGKKEAFEYIDLAYKAGTPFVRILISRRPEADEADIYAAEKAYAEICEYAADKKVCPLIETNGIFADSEVLAKFIKSISSNNKGILWDIHHPWRFYGEKPEKTYKNIGEYIKYLHIKDSVQMGADAKIEYRMVGHGDLPILDIVKILHKNLFDGYLSLEWTKRWCPELQEPGIVFSHYVNHMQSALANFRT